MDSEFDIFEKNIDELSEPAFECQYYYIEGKVTVGESIAIKMEHVRKLEDAATKLKKCTGLSIKERKLLEERIQGVVEVMLLSMAYDFCRRGIHTLSIVLCREVIRSHSRRYEAWYRLLRSLEELHEFAEMEREIRRLSRSMSRFDDEVLGAYILKVSETYPIKISEKVIEHSKAAVRKYQKFIEENYPNRNNPSFEK